ncbi:MAG: ATP-binding cassette domain-containing protein, partial [Spirochaetia bacterium]|nr:ATP-binding cassette domain-containing protein [Spirochaetia bacterium]
SGGERRRVEIARALAADPKIILLDEPFAGVDPIAVKDIQEVIREIQKLNLGILITDHNVRETLKIVSRAYIMSQGKILLKGTAKELIESKQAREIYLGEDFSL